jgi:pilus assembly protein Flp/PilA
MKKLLDRLFRDDEGQDLIEYGLLVGVITLGAIVAITAIGPTVAGYFTDLTAALPSQRGRPSREARMLRFVVRIVREDEAQDLIEYGLLLGIITLASVLAMTSVGSTISGYFTDLSVALP